MKLIEKLAPYLPYGLKFYQIHTSYIDEFTLVGIYEFLNYKQDYYKPILHPLSNLTKEIEHNGEKFIPYDRLKTIVSNNQWIKIYNTIGNDYEKICDMPYWWVNQIIKWHFDIHGLIEEGLAIDINTLNHGI